MPDPELHFALFCYELLAMTSSTTSTPVNTQVAVFVGGVSQS